MSDDTKGNEGYQRFIGGATRPEKPMAELELGIGSYGRPDHAQAMSPSKMQDTMGGTIGPFCFGEADAPDLGEVAKAVGDELFPAESCDKP